MIKSLILSITTACALSACSGVSVDTNLNPGNFTEYFNPSAVTVTTYSDLQDKVYQVISPVHGLSCQQDADDFPANEADARTALKRAAADKGANALIINKCVTARETGACLLSVTCYGDAVYVREED